MSIIELLTEVGGLKTTKTKWNPPEGFFTKRPDDIATGLKRTHSSLASAMSSLVFYMNRTGSSPSAERRDALEAAQQKLRALHK